MCFKLTAYITMKAIGKIAPMICPINTNPANIPPPAVIPPNKPYAAMNGIICPNT